MSQSQAPGLRTDIPHSARIWNFWMGGTDNFPVDRAVGEESLKLDPGIAPMTVQCRKFLIRAVRYLAAEAGVRQFLDIGTGLPTMQNTHEVAQSVAPESKIVYVDHDPLVLKYARTLLADTTDEGVTVYLDADYNDPGQVVSDARGILNFTQPVAVMFMGSLGHASSHDDMLRIIRAVMETVPSGSYLAMYDGTTDRQEYVTLCEEYAKSGGLPYHPRTPDEIRAAFDGLELVEPGCVPVNEWRVDSGQVDAPLVASAYCGVARKALSRRVAAVNRPGLETLDLLSTPGALDEIRASEYAEVMSYPEITQRDLRLKLREIMDAVEHGQSFTVTRDGHRIGELVPLHRRCRFVSKEEFTTSSRNAPDVDLAAFRADQETVLNQEPTSSYGR